ncbi:unnamed protein product [Litomosoides sigmodontis]|uniref:Myb-like domain-containing protein n=1 Tax=Litomosoides sigmodontis TaxID=42156 RepID=A0A3P6TUS6_LITSI|nr:unnamed protein product [Litomosoides sigmodontis]
MKRIRNLVEIAYRKDPRIAMFKEQEKLKKENQRNERRKALEEKKAEDERKKLEIELENKKVEEEKLEKERQQRAYEKRIKEQQKKLLGEARRKLRRTAEGKNYWDADVSSKLSCLEAIEYVCLRFDAVQLNEITAKLELLSNITEAMSVLNVQIHEEITKNETKNEVPQNTTDNASNWTSDEITLLVKATNLYPAGTTRRWSEITNYINEHCESKNAKKKTEKDILIQVKTLKSLTNAQDQKKVKDILLNSAKKSELEWKAEEQKLLEAALRKFASTDPNRWENIANYVGKSKKDCIRRFKYLAEVVKNKKQQLY